MRIKVGSRSFEDAHVPTPTAPTSARTFEMAHSECNLITVGANRGDGAFCIPADYGIVLPTLPVGELAMEPYSMNMKRQLDVATGNKDEQYLDIPERPWQMVGKKERYISE